MANKIDFVIIRIEYEPLTAVVQHCFITYFLGAVQCTAGGRALLSIKSYFRGASTLDRRLALWPHNFFYGRKPPIIPM